jgi:hypothetical protein
MRRWTAILKAGAIATALAAGASPVAALERMNATEMRAELFGTHQFGREANSGLLVDECIEPSGHTVYCTRPDDQRDAPYSQPGRMVVTDEALACFTYPSSQSPGPHCFAVFRNGPGYVFQSVDGNARFEIDKVFRNIADCPKPGLFLSGL